MGADIGRVTVPLDLSPHIDGETITSSLLKSLAAGLREAADRLDADRPSKAIRDNDGDIWRRQDDGLYTSPDNPGLAPHSLDRIKATWGPVTVISE